MLITKKKETVVLKAKHPEDNCRSRNRPTFSNSASFQRIVSIRQLFFPVVFVARMKKFPVPRFIVDDASLLEEISRKKRLETRRYNVIVKKKKDALINQNSHFYSKIIFVA